MRGWLVVNGYLQSDKFDEIYTWLIEAARKRKCELIKIGNDQIDLITKASNEDVDNSVKPEFVLFWDKDVSLAKILESEGFRVFNNAAAIEICDDKALTYIKLKNTDIKMPKTFVAPMTFDNEYKNYEFVQQAQKHLGYPMVIKENKGSFGEQVYLVNNYEEAVERIKSIGHCNFIMQEFVESSKGNDVRIHVVGNKIVTAMERINENDFRANITNGGKMKEYLPSKEQQEMALQVCRSLKLDFAGVDIMFGKNEEPVFCEVNSNAHFKNIYDCTKVNVAEHIIDYILEEINK